MKKINFGFTMIELLIVIAVLGVLAVAVLAAINPIEQINIGRDTGSRSDVEQLIGAIDRYYTVKEYYPWQTGADLETMGMDFTEITSLAPDDGTTPLLTKLSEGGTAEIKSSFASRVGTAANPLFIYNGGAPGNSTYVCFIPQSSQFRDDAWNRCQSSTLPTDMPVEACPAGATCVGAITADLATGCYSCLP